MCRVQNPDLSLAGRSGAAHGGAVGQGGAEQDRTPTDRFAQATIVPRVLGAPKTSASHDSSATRQKETLVKPTEQRKRTLDKRFIHRTKSALRSWLVTRFNLLLVFCEQISCKALPRT